LGNLLEISTALGHSEGMEAILALVEAGLLFPDPFGSTNFELHSLPRFSASLHSFQQWLACAGATGYTVFAPPLVLSRALGEELGIPECSAVDVGTSAIHEADGLECPQRLAVVWQQLNAGSLRRTQQGDFFKRDLDRLRSDPMLNASPADNLGEIRDLALLAVALAQALGIVVPEDGELAAGKLP